MARQADTGSGDGTKKKVPWYKKIGNGLKKIVTGGDKSSSSNKDKSSSSNKDKSSSGGKNGPAKIPEKTPPKPVEVKTPDGGTETTLAFSDTKAANFGTENTQAEKDAAAADKLLADQKDKSKDLNGGITPTDPKNEPSLGSVVAPDKGFTDRNMPQETEVLEADADGPTGVAPEIVPPKPPKKDDKYIPPPTVEGGMNGTVPFDIDLTPTPDVGEDTINDGNIPEGTESQGRTGNGSAGNTENDRTVTPNPHQNDIPEPNAGEDYEDDELSDRNIPKETEVGGGGVGGNEDDDGIDEPPEELYPDHWSQPVEPVIPIPDVPTPYPINPPPKVPLPPPVAPEPEPEPEPEPAPVVPEPPEDGPPRAPSLYRSSPSGNFWSQGMPTVEETADKDPKKKGKGRRRRALRLGAKSLAIPTVGSGGGSKTVGS